MKYTKEKRDDVFFFFLNLLSTYLPKRERNNYLWRFSEVNDAVGGVLVMIFDSRFCWGRKTFLVVIVPYYSVAFTWGPHPFDEPNPGILDIWEVREALKRRHVLGKAQKVCAYDVRFLSGWDSSKNPATFLRQKLNKRQTSVPYGASWKLSWRMLKSSICFSYRCFSRCFLVLEKKKTRLESFHGRMICKLSRYSSSAQVRSFFLSFLLSSILFFVLFALLLSIRFTFQCVWLKS